MKLFSYLKGPGNIHRLVEISLNSCRVGNLGLAAIASYVDGNDHLQLLLLQNVSMLGPADTLTDIYAYLE